MNVHCGGVLELLRVIQEPGLGQGLSSCRTLSFDCSGYLEKALIINITNYNNKKRIT